MQNTFKISLDKISMVYKIGWNAHIVNLEAFDIKMMDDGYSLKQEFESARYGAYQYNYTYVDGKNPEGVIYIGFYRNDPVKTKRYVKIEYNPNKAELPRPIINLLYGLECVLEKIQSVDIAFDFDGLTYDDYRVHTRGDTMVYSSGVARTFYVRPKGEGRVKIYDKTKERAKLGIEIPQTLRVEITVKDPYFFCIQNIREGDILYAQQYVKYLSEISVRRRTAVLPSVDADNPKEKYNEVILYLLNNVDQVTAQKAIGMMSVNHRTKYRNLMAHSEFEPIDINEITFIEVVSSMIRKAVPIWKFI